MLHAEPIRGCCVLQQNFGPQRNPSMFVLVAPCLAHWCWWLVMGHSRAVKLVTGDNPQVNSGVSLASR